MSVTFINADHFIQGLKSTEERHKALLMKYLTLNDQSFFEAMKIDTSSVLNAKKKAVIKFNKGESETPLITSDTINQCTKKSLQTQQYVFSF